MFFLSVICATIPLITAIIRRLHDIGKDGLLSILWFIPLANIYLLLLLATKKKSFNADNTAKETPKIIDKDDDKIEKLHKLSNMRDQKILTDEEFDIQKKKILGK